ncbi:hypothetical protein DPMN_144709 [Dreissena polymorpha]|uniref:Uncharacterized protein n=1 Tax=Dreissena polymorpha TaxID=45954 RepID=A0A9D4J0K7_DREPO|nr:hypothetical protein DPMN_144709 [Dreissena polymorpha]
MGLIQLEEEWRLVEEAERQKKESASRKQRKQGSGGGAAKRTGGQDGARQGDTSRENNMEGECLAGTEERQR